MTRFGPRHVVTRVGDVIVVTDEGQGVEVSMQMQDAARLVTALPYLLTGSTAVQDIAAERLRHIAHHSRSEDLAGGLPHVEHMLQVADALLNVAGAQVASLADVTTAERLARVIVQGGLPQPPGWPEGWAWHPHAHPAQNAATAAALLAGVMDVLNTLQALGEAMPRTS